MVRLMASPIPSPCGLVLTKWPKMRSRSASFTPTPLSRIDDGDPLVIGLAGFDADLARPFADDCNGVFRIAQQVDHHLAQLDAVAQHFHQRLEALEVHADLSIAQIAAEQVQHILDHVIHVEFRLHRGPSCETAPAAGE